MNKIILYEGQSQYDVLNIFTHNLAKELSLYAPVEIINLKEENSISKINEAINEGVDLTIGFNCMGFWDTYKKLNIPHLAILVDHPIYHMETLDLTSKSLVVSCTDVERTGFLKQNGNFDNCFVLNHAIDANIEPDYYNKNYDIVMFGGLKSSNKIRRELKEKYKKSEKLFDMIEEITEIVANNSLFSIEALIDSVLFDKGIDISSSKERINWYKVLIKDVDLYSRNLSREKALLDFKEFNINVFGNCDIDESIKCDNIKFNPSVSYSKAIEIMRMSKISLNSTKTILNGTHERPLLAAGCGSIVLTNKTKFFENTFKKNAIYYNDVLLNEGKEKIREVLNNDSKRREMTIQAHSIVRNNHTWKNRSKQILNILNNKNI